MLTRIISLTGNTELIEVSPELYISKYFYDLGYRIESDIQGQYSKHVLLQELKSGILGERFRLWDADGVKSVVFENGVRYSMDEIKKLDGLSDERIVEAHHMKSVLGGEVIE